LNFPAWASRFVRFVPLPRNPRAVRPEFILIERRAEGCLAEIQVPSKPNSSVTRGSHVIGFQLRFYVMEKKIKNSEKSNSKSKLRIKMRTWKEVEAYKARHLKPRGFGPKGRPIYDFNEVCN
jgi:hypothetical protein